ncbi:MAG: KpsF/GutQ family sugar-phosphate isomerase [Rikenellaceae bacterium]
MNKEQIKHFAQQIITVERDAITNLISFVDEDFIEVATLILNSKGRVVITGIGKSAIIASKIVATLNSTGTPSIFMHGADAIHGDLGMIQENDTVICISKSGNTPEINVLIPLIRNLGKKNVVVAFVGNLKSFLAESSDYVINTTVDVEACPNNLAPTSSTTAQLVMGDALAMTLLKMRGFSANDFAVVHPGGALGKRLYTRVRDVLSEDSNPSVMENATIDEVIIEISSKMLGATVVLNSEQKLLGIITDGDLRRMLQSKRDLSQVTAKDIMSKNPKCVNIDELAVKAFSIMENKKITQLIVTDDNKTYRGIVHIHQILKEGVV